MQIIKPSFEILAFTPDMTKLIERGIRTAYKSEDRIEEGSDRKIISHIKTLKHESTLEHGSITVKFITDRGVTHELVRHRICSFTQESTRYCNYSKGKFGSEITVIEPFFFKVISVNDIDNVQEVVDATRKNELLYESWKHSCEAAEKEYLTQLALNCRPQEARDVLPNSLKTEIVVTANVREWRKIFELRTSKEAHPQIRQIMCPLLKVFRESWDMLFDDVGSIEHECPAIHVSGAESKKARLLAGADAAIRVLREMSDAELADALEGSSYAITHAVNCIRREVDMSKVNGGPGWEMIGLGLPA